MPNPPAPRPLQGQVIAPTALEKAKERADAERARIAAEAHAEGKQQGLRHAGAYRDVALMAIGFIIGGAMAGLYFTSMQERAAMTAGAIARSVVEQTVQTPAPAAAPLQVLTPEQVEQECRRGQRRNGLCPGEPASAQRR